MVYLHHYRFVYPRSALPRRRVDVAWGGFNVVQASLNAVTLAMQREIPFHWLWILSGTTYPIASNDSIRAKLASHHPESVGGAVAVFFFLLTV